MNRVALVTDSTAYLPPGLVAEHGITVVPVQVIVAGQCYDDGVDITPVDVAAALRDYRPVSTSRPNPEAFLRAYQRAAADGATAVVSAHLSSDISGTYGSALLAASEAPLPVEVVDTRSIGMGLGFPVLSGAVAAAEGADAVQVAEVVRARAAGVSVLFYVDTLEYLRRGGRIRAGQAAIGSALAIKPLLAVVDGVVTPFERVRTASKALARLEEVVIARAGESAAGTVDVAVQHIGAPERAAALAAHLSQRLGVEVVESELGAVVGAHVGPGTVAVVVSPRPLPSAQD